ncbi:hypothetical protein M413DRAFT_428109 [Hebeloma cylindrosporum]|uniref:Uncharacterized protein n=1 Tax=Hebeloma cylindrosporum TaxID=76867 RepID=A0A0C3BH00_HEBCY|nr:hypothetical protein M413DRAFT_428109 [Hebeloma cylindrosporum h7]
MLTRILTALIIASVVRAAPVEQMKRATEASVTIQICTGNVGAAGCVTIPVVSDTCINFTGGLTFLNKEVSGAVIPGGFICTFAADFGCDVPQGGGVTLTSGSWSMFSVPGTAGLIDFNDQASSFTCSPV